MTHHNTSRYVDKLQDFISGYNNRVHSSTLMAPNEIQDGSLSELAWANIELKKSFNGPSNGAASYINKKTLTQKKTRELAYTKQTRPKPKFKIGDIVRTSLSRTVYSRGFTPNYSEAHYEIFEVIDRGLLYTYRLKDPFDENGEPLRGEFYTHELIAAVRPTEFVIEDILDVKKIGSDTYGLTKWLGYNLKKDLSWRLLSKADIDGLKNTHADLWEKLRDSYRNSLRRSQRVKKNSVRK